jgi:hypothetical protein
VSAAEQFPRAIGITLCRTREHGPPTEEADHDRISRAVPGRRRTSQVSLWASICVVATAFVALAVWFVVTVSTATSSTPSVQQGGGTGNNQLCAPAPGTNYC